MNETKSFPGTLNLNEPGPRAHPTMRIAGIMSGTSLDGVDIALVDVQGKGWGKRLRTLAFHSEPYPKKLRDALLGVSNAVTHTADISRLNVLLAEVYAEAFERACEEARIPAATVDLIGSHGQTIFHEGEAIRYLGRSIASTLQIGDGSFLAERTGIPVVSDFRMRDMAAGGKGAPLVPFVDYILYRHPSKTRVALNIGGIANITLIPAGGRPEDVIAFDTGPGNMVSDGLVAHLTEGRHSYDEDGRIAAHGKVDRELLSHLTRDAFYRRKPPKTAGREQYGEEFLQRFIAAGLSPADTLATAVALTAVSVGLGLRRFCPRPDEVIVSGGGVHNLTMMAMLAEQVRPARLFTSSMLGIDPNAKEAVAFAVLAYETWHDRPGNLPSATGARRPVVLGKLSRACA